MSDRIQYQDKTDDSNGSDNERKYFSNDANEVKSVVNSHANDIETIQAQLGTSTPSVGGFTSLALLNVTYPNGNGNSYAIIDAGSGATPQIAIYDTDDSEWVISGSVSDIVKVNEYSFLPSPGIENTWYVTLDNYNMYLWLSGQYILMNNTPTGFNTLSVKEKQNSAITGTGTNGVSFTYSDSTNKVTHAVFSEGYSPYLTNIIPLLTDKDVYVAFYNITTQKTLVAKVLAIVYTDTNNNFYRATLENSINESDISAQDVLVVSLSFSSQSSEGSGGSTDGNQEFIFRANTTEDIAPNSSEISSPVNGDSAEINLNDTIVEKWVFNNDAWIKRYKLEFSSSGDTRIYKWEVRVLNIASSTTWKAVRFNTSKMDAAGLTSSHGSGILPANEDQANPYVISGNETIQDVRITYKRGTNSERNFDFTLLSYPASNDQLPVTSDKIFVNAYNHNQTLSNVLNDGIVNVPFDNTISLAQDDALWWAIKNVGASNLDIDVFVVTVETKRF